MTRTPTNNFDRFLGRLEIRGKLTTLTPLRIATGGSDDLTGPDITVVKDALGRPTIPGSSFKGVLRATLESLLRAMDPALACLCVTTDPKPDEHAPNAVLPPPSTCPTTMNDDGLKAARNRVATQRQLGRDYDKLWVEQKQIVDDQLYLEESCRVCQVFGSPGLASKVRVPDMAVRDPWYGRYGLRQSVSIDRDTETAAPGRLFTSEVVPAGTVFDCAVIIENGSQADEGLVLLGLRAFERELVTLGGGASRGLGRVGLAIDTCQAIGGTADALISYLVSGQPAAVAEAERHARISAFIAEVRE